MTSAALRPTYVLGSSDLEHERLIRQATYLASATERFFRDAGIGRGQRVLDLGSGVGDVAMLVARLVGPSGEVVGIERDARSIARARSRAVAAGLENVRFIQCDASQVDAGEPFDAAVGRFILQFLPEPVSVLRSLSRLVRPGGLVAFQEVSWAYFLERWAHVPLWSAACHIAHETLQRLGANLEIGFALYQMFQNGGLPAPVMNMVVPLGNDRQFIGLIYDLLCSLLPEAERLNLPVQALGNLSTLLERLQAEIAASDSVVSWMGLIGAWTRK